MEKILKHFKSIIDIFSDGIYISDRDGTTLLVNRMYEQLTGLRQQDLRGRNVNALVEEGVFDRIVNPEIVRSRRPSTSVQNVRGEKKIILRGYPVLDEAGEVCLVVTFARDITMITQFRDQIAQQKQLIDEFHERLESMIQTNASPTHPIFRSESMLSLVARLQRVAGTDATLLLLGETGVGKDVLARLAHEHSPRSERMFLKVDCGSIAPNLIESELFGYVPGAFSGANAKGKAGYFEMADGGTVFLDEIGELPLPMQTKLLRVLQDQEVTRVGATQPRKVDVRIIAATNRDLDDDVRTGKFRSDLFYRLSVAVLQIPPLRERREDIAPLARHFLERYAAKYRRSMEIAESTLEALENYRWPGNVREMQNFIQSMVVTGDRGLPPRPCLHHAGNAGPACPARDHGRDRARNTGTGHRPARLGEQGGAHVQGQPHHHLPQAARATPRRREGRDGRPARPLRGCTERTAPDHGSGGLRCRDLPGPCRRCAAP